MNFEIIGKLMMLAASSVIFSAGFYLLQAKTAFGKLNKLLQQGIIGLGFGILAILGTEFGVDVGGATANARDAAPICAALFFGAPSGLIAGLIGGIWRWFAAAWGAGMYSRVACTVSTVLAGVIAAFLREFMFDNKRANWIFGLIIGSTVEILHLTILFMTHLGDPAQAFEIVKICTIPMVFCNGLAVMLSALSIALLSKELHSRKKQQYLRISQLVQTPLLIAVIVAFLFSMGMIFLVQTSSAKRETTSLMKVNMDSVRADIIGESDSTMLNIAHSIAAELDVDEELDLNILAATNGVAVIYIIDENGIVVRSTDESTIGFDMRFDADLPEEEQQANKFMVLLEDDCNEYVQELRPMAVDGSLEYKLAGVSLQKGGFVQVGYDADMFIEEIENQIRILVTNRHVGENGYLIITDEDYRIITDNSEYDGHNVQEYGINVSETPHDELAVSEIAGTPVYLMLSDADSFHILGIMSKDDVFLDRDNMLYVYAYLMILIFAALFIIIYFIIKKVIVNNIRSVNKSLAKIMGGNLDTTVDVHSSEEFASLSDDINSTVDTLKRYINEAASRIDADLKLAKDIQHSTLPSVFPAFPMRTDFDIYATMDTAREVGGDFYDFYFIDENKFAILIADVS